MFYNNLVKSTEKEKKSLYDTQIIKDAISGNVTIGEYIYFLSQAYHHVKYTAKLMMYMGSLLSISNKNFLKASREYINEEYGHEEWILNDISNSSYDKEKVKNSVPNIHTKLIISYAYDLISRKNPLCFFGMVYVLEGTSIELADKAANAIKKSLNLNNNSFSYLVSHGSLDKDHVLFFENLMNEIKLESDQCDIIESAKDFFYLYKNILHSVKNPHLDVNNWRIL